MKVSTFISRLLAIPVLLLVATIAAAAELSPGSGDVDRLNAEISQINENAKMPQGESIVTQQLMDDFDVSSDRINKLQGSMTQYGDVAAVLAFAEKLPGGISDGNIDEIMKIRSEGTWEDVALNFGVFPGSIAGRLSSVQDGIQTALAESAFEGRAAGGGSKERKPEPDRSDPLYQ